MTTIPKNCTVAEERRAYFVLVDATDKVTPEGGVTVSGQKVNLSFRGAADAPSTNDIVLVDATFGLYYIELTQTESNTGYGAGMGFLKPTGCAECYIPFQIGVNGLYSEPLAEPIDVNVTQINGVSVIGAGTSGDKWRA